MRAVVWNEISVIAILRFGQVKNRHLDDRSCSAKSELKESVTDRKHCSIATGKHWAGPTCQGFDKITLKLAQKTLASFCDIAIWASKTLASFCDIAIWASRMRPLFKDSRELREFRGSRDCSRDKTPFVKNLFAVPEFSGEPLLSHPVLDNTYSLDYLSGVSAL